MENCLVVRNYGHIGDLLMLTPALKELSKTYLVDLQIPEKYKEVFKNLKFINSIFFKKPKKKYVKIFDLSDYEFNYEQIYSKNISKTKQELFAECLNVSITDLKPIIKLDADEKRWINTFIKKIDKKILVLAPKSANPTRDWKLNNWKSLITKLKKLNYQIIIADYNLNWEDESIIFFNNHSLRKLFALIYVSDFIVSHDSGLLHMAGAFNKPCLGIFGPTDPKLRAIYEKSYFVSQFVSCAPCWYDRCADLTCMASLKVNKVENKILEMIQNEI